MITGQGKMEVTEQGAKREANDGRGRFDLLPYESLEALAKWSEDGARKYGDRNWEKGLSVKDCLNRMLRHAIKATNGWTDEDHLAAVMWNASAAITMMQRRPDCNDHPWHEPPVATKSTDKKPTDYVGDIFPDMIPSQYHRSDVTIHAEENAVYRSITDETGVLDDAKGLTRTMVDHSLDGISLPGVSVNSYIEKNKKHGKLANFIPEGE